MTFLRAILIVAGCAALSACGPSKPRSSLILGSDPADLSLGSRTLTTSQTRALQKVITTAGEACGALVGQAFLRDIDPTAGRETWEVQCTEAPYLVMVRADNPAGAVRECVGGGLRGSPCSEPYSGRSSWGRGRRPPEGPLNPDLQKLLEPMTAKDGKSD